jgi:glutamate dehydrogenase
MMRTLGRAGRLDMAVEFLPDGDQMRKRAAAGQPLTRPELCVLLAYGKIVANEHILASDLPDDPLLEQEVLRYFPSAMGERFAQSIRVHRLRREIIALQVTNSMVNRVGSTFLHDLNARTGHETPDIARAFTVTRDAWRLRDIWGAIEALDPKLIAEAQTEMLIATQRFIERVSVWLLQNVAQPMNMLTTTERFRPVVAALEQDLESLAAATIAARAEAFTKLGAPGDIARRVAALDKLAAAGDVALLAEANGRPVAAVARLYFALGERLGLDWLTDAGAGLPREGAWAGQAANALTDDLLAAQRNLSAAALEEPDASADAEATLAAWVDRRKQALERFDALLAELRASGTPDLAMLAVAARQLRTLERAEDFGARASLPASSSAVFSTSAGKDARAPRI